MYGQLRGLRFEEASLGLVILSIVFHYGLVLGEAGPGRRATVFEHVRAAVEAPAPRLPGSASQAGTEARLFIATVPAAQAQSIVSPSVARLKTLFRRIDYRLGGVRAGTRAVPRILVERMPAELGGIDSAPERKRVFIKLMLPLVLQVNERIMDQRQRLLALQARAHGDVERLAPPRRAWLERLAARYGLAEADFGTLVRRVDVVPPSLALAQAAEESGWGTSRFVREGNAVFGQWTFTEGSGLVPRRREDGKRHRVRSFERLVDSVAAYMINLNSHRAYRGFRLVRERQRRTQSRLDGYALAGTLESYSERGEDYVETIRSIIATNGLHAFDRARLREKEFLVGSQPQI